MTFDEWVVDFVTRARTDKDAQRLRMLRFETDGYALRRPTRSGRWPCSRKDAAWPSP